MRVCFFQETDSLYIDLAGRESVDSQEVAAGIVLDFDGQGCLVGIDIDRASQVVGLSRLEVEGFPLTSLSLTRPEAEPAGPVSR